MDSIWCGLSKEFSFEEINSIIYTTMTSETFEQIEYILCKDITSETFEQMLQILSTMLSELKERKKHTQLYLKTLVGL